MPTQKGMLLRQSPRAAFRALVALLAAAFVTMPVAARAAGPTSSSNPSSTTTTTAPPKPKDVPAPAPFGLPLDAGLKFVTERDQASKEVKDLVPKVRSARARTAEVVSHKRIVDTRRRKLDAKMRETLQHLAETRAHLRSAAATAYVHAGSGQLDAAISSFTNAKSAVDIGRDMHIIGVYGDRERVALQNYLAVKQLVDQQIRDVAAEQARVRKDLSSARSKQAELERKLADAKHRLAEAVAGIEQFHKDAVSSTSPILGPSRLTAKQLSDFVLLKGYKPRITVPIQELAQDYLDEGNRYGVRGDVAFAQSILETAGFHLPDGGQLNPTDNNFAGIGACDSCKHGMTFPDARTGVRAQMQLLRTYVDKKFDDKTSPDPILLKGALKLGFRGKVQTWWDLWGTWATGALYGEHVYNLYLQIVAFSALDPPK
jgi:mannosyl-glycoprotein endo-beta-N-acetylglucosaminidase